MNEWDLNFCKNLCYLRQKHCLSAKEMAAILGVSVATYRKMERCAETVKLRASLLIRVCDHFHLSSDAMLRQRWHLDVTE